MKQMWQVFQMTRRYDPSSQWLMLLGFLAPVLVGLALALWLGEGNGFTIALWVVAGVLAGLLLALVILGMGEEREEVSQALRDLHDAGTDIITVTQYLRPSPRHLPVARWVRPEEFVEIKEEAEEIGFLGVLAGPLVRSSYRAGRLWAQSMHAKGRQLPDSLAHLADASLGFAQAVG